jgi:hypothetical protein
VSSLRSNQNPARRLRHFVALLALIASATPVGHLAETALADQGDCGQPFSAGAFPLASDALFTLRAGVELVNCPLAVCDVDGNGSISASDALAVLYVAAQISSPDSLNCPPPAVTTTSSLPSTTTTAAPVPFSNWTEIQGFFATTCDSSFCHGLGGAAGGLEDLDDYDSGYDNLVNTAVACSGSNFSLRVVPGDADNSFLFEKLRAPVEERAPECRLGMPLGGDPLTPEQLAGIRAWIESGAPKN